MEKLKDYYFTFKQNSIHRNNYVVIRAENMVDACNQMMKRFGTNRWVLIANQKGFLDFKKAKDLKEMK
jgi:hypothetical protein